MVIEQAPQDQRSSYFKCVRIEIKESGVLIFDGNVSGRVDRGGGDTMMEFFFLAEEDVEEFALASLQFAAGLYSRYDPHGRHQRFLFNAAISELGNRKLVRNPAPQSSYGTIFSRRRALW